MWAACTRPAASKGWARRRPGCATSSCWSSTTRKPCGSHFASVTSGASCSRASFGGFNYAPPQSVVLRVGWEGSIRACPGHGKKLIMLHVTSGASCWICTCSVLIPGRCCDAVSRSTAMWIACPCKTSLGLHAVPRTKSAAHRRWPD